MADFHFIRPLWLIGIVALIFALYLLKKYRINQSGWHQLLPAHLSKVLVDGSTKTQSASLMLPFIIGLLTIIALAGPTWKKLPQPVYQLARGSVIIMDMSYSMYATDLSPNRLTRARYKAIDLLDQLNEGEIGLIAYAGDAFTISPLTEDINNIKLLLPSLSPDLMPALGSNPYSALALANDMLKNAGHLEGDIYWFTDGIDREDLQDITQWNRKHPYRLNILAIGTSEGAPIKLTNGELMKDDNGSIVIPKLTEKSLQGAASSGQGYYARITNSSADIKHLVSQPIVQDDDKKSESAQTGDQWQEFGPYLLLLVLPLVLGYFRRGNLLAIIPCLFLLTPTQPVHADFWTDLWKTKDQQGQAHFNNKEFEQAAEQFENSQWQGSAHYNAGNYEQALASFQKGNDAQSLYNQGNALAKLQKLDEAITAYDKALQLNPDHQDAQANKALLEKLKQQQDQQQQQNQEQQNDQENSDQENQDQQQDQNGDQQQEQQEQSEQQQSDQNQQQNSDENAEQDSEQDQQQQNEQQQNEQQSQEQKEQEEQEQQAEQQEDESAEQSEQQQQAQAIKAQQEKETEQKHKQLLNKVTDDPYLLLRNKMQLEYQKRRQDRSSVGVKKKW
ncbi:VWA domain-containing protein [Colwellia sp. 1_MG-2023]|uniref:vWA domain-containing protein n=1 Tax=Colwellia sp. 1_MG-2023 TaxID=3062649 RepID=UPI0026E1839A|nr:VWA domain-containing protein [Colwellia sp. 1_MG-2023]MDO6444289.1 VWA domain-containing protein [Colwellia sp. 1_MG-2023]